MTERGKMLSYMNQSRPAPEAPRILPQVVIDTPVSPNQTFHRYATVMARFLRFKIVAIAGDAEDIALCQAIMSYPEHWDGYISFSDWFFATPHLSVAKFLDKRIRLGMAKGVSRDISSIMMRCAQCDRMFPNTPHGQEDYVSHLVTDHPDNVLSYQEPVFTDGPNRQGERLPTPEEINPPVIVIEDEVESEMEFGEDFQLNAEVIPVAVAEAMEKDNGIGTEDTERLSHSKPGGRSGGRRGAHS